VMASKEDRLLRRGAPLRAEVRW